MMLALLYTCNKSDKFDNSSRVVTADSVVTNKEEAVVKKEEDVVVDEPIEADEA